MTEERIITAATVTSGEKQTERIAGIDSEKPRSGDGN